MKITFTGTLADENGKVLVSSRLRGCIYNQRGTLSAIASGKSSANGSFKMTASGTFPDTPLPRVAVQILHKNKWLMLTDQVTSFTKGTADFSKILFHETALYKIGTTPYYGDNHTVSLSTPLVIRHLDQPIRMVTPGNAPNGPTLNLSEVNTLNSELANLRKIKTDLTRERDTFKTELTGKENLIKAKEKEIARVRTDLTKVHESQIANKEATIKKLQDANEELKKPTPDRVSIDDIAFSTGTQIEEVQRRLTATNSSLRLSKVSLQMKGLADPSGRAMVLPPKKDIAALASGMSVLNLDFSPRITGKQATPTDTAETTPEQIESYLGLTEAAARRQLEAQSIAYRMYNQPLKKDDTKNLGRIIHQSPTPGSRAEPDTVLKLIVGKSQA